MKRIVLLMLGITGFLMIFTTFTEIVKENGMGLSISLLAATVSSMILGLFIAYRTAHGSKTDRVMVFLFILFFVLSFVLASYFDSLFPIYFGRLVIGFFVFFFSVVKTILIVKTVSVQDSE